MPDLNNEIAMLCWTITGIGIGVVSPLTTLHFLQGACTKAYESPEHLDMYSLCDASDLCYTSIIYIKS